uniref:Secreted protein n=1 Tax=Gorilla gorilla gorilla TaxID=9595 RepID=A0A2I2YG36_GORGO
MQIVQGFPADAPLCALMWTCSFLLPGLQTETPYPCTSLCLSSSQSAHPPLPVRVFSAESDYGIPFCAEPCSRVTVCHLQAGPVCMPV